MRNGGSLYLDKLCIQVLEQLVELGNPENGVVHFNEIEKIEEVLDISTNELASCINVLESGGYAKTFPTMDDLPDLGHVTSLGMSFLRSLREEKPTPTAQQVTNFNFSGNVENSIVGTQQNATINISQPVCESLDEFRKKIDTADAADQAALKEILGTLEQISTGMLEPKRGVFRRVMDTIKPYSWAVPVVLRVLYDFVGLG